MPCGVRGQTGHGLVLQQRQCQELAAFLSLPFHELLHEVKGGGYFRKLRKVRQHSPGKDHLRDFLWGILKLLFPTVVLGLGKPAVDKRGFLSDVSGKVRKITEF